MDILAFLIMVLLLVGIARMVIATLAIQKNTREVADYFNWLASGRSYKQPNRSRS